MSQSENSGDDSSSQGSVDENYELNTGFVLVKDGKVCEKEDNYTKRKGYDGRAGFGSEEEDNPTSNTKAVRASLPTVSKKKTKLHLSAEGLMASPTAVVKTPTSSDEENSLRRSAPLLKSAISRGHRLSR